MSVLEIEVVLVVTAGVLMVLVLLAWKDGAQ